MIDFFGCYLKREGLASIVPES